jgi:hypothetical protein
MSPLSTVDAVSLLFNSPDVELELAGGGVLRVHPILVEGESVTATAPRLSVATGMFLTGRVVGPDGRPWELTIHVDDASYHTPDLAMLRLHPTAVGVDDSRRAAERVPIGGVAWLEAVNCQDVVDRDRVDGTLEDLSRTGVAFTTARVLRVGDRLLFHGRFFADSISGEVRVASVRPAAAPGQTADDGGAVLQRDRLPRYLVRDVQQAAGGDLDRLAVTAEAGTAGGDDVQLLLAAELGLAVRHDQLAAGVRLVGVDAEAGDAEVIADRVPSFPVVGRARPLVPEAGSGRAGNVVQPLQPPAHQRSTCEPPVITSRPSGYLTQALWVPS